MLGVGKLALREHGNATTIKETVVRDAGSLAGRDLHLCGPLARFGIEPKEKLLRGADVQNDLLLGRFGESSINAQNVADVHKTT
jgi:hypothetical protein